MRYWLASLTAVLFLGSIADAQLLKKKDVGKVKPTEPTKFKVITELQGRSFTDWQRDIKDKDPSRRELAIKAVMEFGPEKAYEALPDIIDELKEHNKKKGARIDLSTCVAGTTALSTIIKFNKAPDPKYLKDAVAIFRVFLKDEQVMLRVLAVQNLPYLGPTCRDALPEVRTLAREPSTWEAREEAVKVLGFIGYDDFIKGRPNEYVMADVFRALSDPAASVRIAALRSCAALAQKADAVKRGQAFGRFRAAFGDPDKHVALAAHTCFIMLEGKATPAQLNPIVKMLTDVNPEVRMDALQSIGALGKEAKGAIAAVKECTGDPEASVAVGAVMLLAGLDWDNSRPFIIRIKDGTTHPEAVRAAATQALEFHEKMAKEKKTTEKK